MGSPDVAVDGEIIEVDPPRKLVQTWHARWIPGEGVTRLIGVSLVPLVRRQAQKGAPVSYRNLRRFSKAALNGRRSHGFGRVDRSEIAPCSSAASTRLQALGAREACSGLLTA